MSGDMGEIFNALRVVGCIAKRPADPDYCGELDAAIDQARGKGGGEVGP